MREKPALHEKELDKDNIVTVVVGTAIATAIGHAPADAKWYV